MVGGKRKLLDKHGGIQMTKCLISIFLCILISSAALADRYEATTSLPKAKLKYKDPTINCGIQFGDAGRDSPWIKVKNNKVTKVNDIGGPWSFIRKTYGPCSFMVYNKDNYKARHANYGSGLTRQRVGSAASADKGGWKARSVIITPHKKTACQVTLQGTNSGTVILTWPTWTYQTFYGPSHISDITGWSVVSKTSGNDNCSYTLYNEKDLSGKRVNWGKVNKPTRVGWKIRSLEISQQ